MTEFVVFCIPAVIYIAVLARGRNGTVRSALSRVGATWGSASSYGWALALLAPLLLTGWLAIVLIPAEVLRTPGVVVGQLTSISAVAGIFLRAVGEEVFFRGLLGGVLVRRLGFALGNSVQAAIFLIPHVALLAVDIRLWPILPVQFAAGWMLGWLRNRSESFVPGSIVHALANILAGLIA